MRETISIHIGQAGVQLLNSTWEILCAEHGVCADGRLIQSELEEDSLSCHSLFQELPSGQFVPRAVCIDLEPSVLDEIRRGHYRQLFHPDQLISGIEDAANNFARAHYTLGKHIIEYTLTRIKKVVEMCENLQGFFIFNSYGGGTGSGFATLLQERISVEFSKITTLQVAIFPSDKLSSSTVDPYNTTLCTTSTIDEEILCTFFDNFCAYNVCANQLDIVNPTYSNLNRIISQIFSSMTVSVRSLGCITADLDQMITNLVPYHRIHFPIFTHAPLISKSRSSHQPNSISALTQLAFEPSSQLVDVVMSKGKYICCIMQYRGDITPIQVNDALFDIKQRSDMVFVDWCPTGFKLGINSKPPVYIPRSEVAQTNRSVTLLTNSSAISQKFVTLGKKFDLLFKKRSFIHWYVGEGMEEMEFLEAREELEFLTSDYDELSEMDNDVEFEMNKVQPPEIFDIENLKINQRRVSADSSNEEVTSVQDFKRSLQLRRS